MLNNPSVCVVSDRGFVFRFLFRMSCGLAFADVFGRDIALVSGVRLFDCHFNAGVIS